MASLTRTYLTAQIGSISNHKQDLDWLVDRDIVGKKIADFGCNDGTKTLALMWAFDAHEIIGIDWDKGYIELAINALDVIRSDIGTNTEYLQFLRDEISMEDKQWWDNDVPSFLKTGRLNSVSYITSDITKPTDLPPDYYDVVFCNFVLHHIWCDQGRENGEADTQAAIEEMVRVASPGGAIAARELIQYSDKPRLCFQQLFKNVGLAVIHAKEISCSYDVTPGKILECICRKPGAPAVP